MKPSKEELLRVNRDEIAEKYGVCQKTVVRWLKSYGIFESQGRGKLNMKKAKEMRNKHSEGRSIKSLAKEYGVSFASASRAIQRITYDDRKPDFAGVSVIYNPN